MSDKEKIVYLLQEVKRLEELLTGVRNAEIYPVSFFNDSFKLTRNLLKELYQLEKEQVETFRKQMELRQAMLQETLLQTSPISIPESQETIYTTQEEPIISTEPILTPEILPETVIIQEEIVDEVVPEPIIEVTETPVTETEEEIKEEIQEEKTIEEILREYAPAAPALIPEKIVTSLSDIIEKKQLSDFRKAFSLNDRFYFLRELFSGNDSRMNEVIADLNEIQSLEESLDYINTKMRWNPEDKPVEDFIHLLEKRFS